MGARALLTCVVVGIILAGQDKLPPAATRYFGT